MIKARNFRNISRNGERGCLEGQEVRTLGNTMATPVGRDSVKKESPERGRRGSAGGRVLRKRAQNEAERFCRGEAITDGVSF